MGEAGGGPEVLWSPTPEIVAGSRIGQFMEWLRTRRGLSFEAYQDLWEWSVTDQEGFWSALWEFFDIVASTPYERVLTDDPMPDTRWFVGAELNYVENLLRGDGSRTALLCRSHTRGPIDLSLDQLRDEVARVRSGLVDLGVGRDDCVAAYLPNIPEAVALLLATASLGAVFVSCAPEFGVQSVLDRFGQLEPTVLVGCDGYRFRGTEMPRTAELAELAGALASVKTVVLVPYLDPAADAGAHGHMSWEQLRARPGPLEFTQVPFDHPLYVLFSSGTTGKPKGLVHAHGPVLLEHLKVSAFHHDLGPGSILFQLATTSWMVWNFGVSVLASGSALVCYDGPPAWPDPMELWRIAAETQATEIAMGAAVLIGTQKAGLTPAREVDLSHLRMLTATGSPLPPDGFRWVYDAFDPGIFLATGSGGTDICTGLVGGTFMLPVTAGEMACRYLGAAVESFDEGGNPVRGRPGELVITKPLPTMPRHLIGDPTGERYRSSYFDTFPGIWRHGDWISITDRGTCTIEGRSDATLNRGGVRIGTAEIYSVVDAIPGVADSAAVHLGRAGSGGDELVLLVALDPDQPSVEGMEDRICSALRSRLSPRHVPDTIHIVDALPRTLTGKKLELPIKRILGGADPESVASRGAITNPGALDDLAELRRTRASRSSPS